MSDGPNSILGKAKAAACQERARRHPGLARHSARLAGAVEVLFEVTDLGEDPGAGAGVDRGDCAPPPAA